MNPRSLDQIMAELNPNYAGSRGIVNQQIAAIPGQQEADTAQLNAQKDRGFADIINSARRRGTGIALGGIPLGEQSQYLSTDYLPALTRLKSQAASNRLTLQGQLADIDRQQRDQAVGIRESDIARAEQARQFDAQLAFQRDQARTAAAARAVPTLNLGSGASTVRPPVAQMAQREGGGFDFADNSGNAISAAKYAQLSGKDIRDVLYEMGARGDSYAAEVYNALRNVSPGRYGNQNVYQSALNSFKAKYPAIFWGA